MSKRTNSPRMKTTSRPVRRSQHGNPNILLWSGLAIVGVIAVVGILWLAFGSTKPVSAMGEAVSVPSRDHVQEGTDLGPYPTDPPAGGHHYPSTYKAGFYAEADVTNLPKQYAGYLVHNLEHGYVIYWYNCQAGTTIKCDDLKSAIKQVIQENNGVKIIGFPWPTLKQPLAITSWGRILRMDKVDLGTMRAFYKANLNQAPEPGAD